MKVDQSRVSQMIKSYDKRQIKNNQKSTKSNKKDKLSLSKEALELQKFKDKLEETSSARQERITRLKRDIKQGNYNVSGEDIAKKMLEQIIHNKKF